MRKISLPELEPETLFIVFALSTSIPEWLGWDFWLSLFLGLAVTLGLAAIDELLYRRKPDEESELALL